MAVDAEIVGREVERLGGAPQTVKVDDFIAAARPADSPLHPLFEWNLKDAAAAHWRQQARHILSSLVITVTSVSTNEPRSTRAFLSTTPEGEERAYVSISRIAAIAICSAKSSARRTESCFRSSGASSTLRRWRRGCLTFGPRRMQ
jgi:hypothetical protein